MTRLTNALLRQPIRVDVFDLTPFEPIGRQSVWLGLTLVGFLIFGCLTLDAVNWSLLQEYLFFGSFVVVFIIAIFYTNTRNVHRVVAAEKKQRLDSIPF